MISTIESTTRAFIIEEFKDHGLRAKIVALILLNETIDVGHGKRLNPSL